MKGKNMYDTVAYEAAMLAMEDETDKRIKDKMETIIEIYENAGYLPSMTDWEDMDENEKRDIVGLNTHIIHDDAIKEMFPDWEKMNPGEWSKHGKIMTTKDETKLEIGLYKEPMNDEYPGSYTLQIFANDDVIFCESVSD